jgi:transcriptional regulator of acetoin/glycerol metabolism
MGKAIIPIPVGTTLKVAEKLKIEAALQHTDGNLSFAAKILGIYRSTMYSKMERHNIR